MSHTKKLDLKTDSRNEAQPGFPLQSGEPISLPQWLAASLLKIRQVGMVSTIPSSIALTDEQRVEISSFIAEIDRRLAERDERDSAATITALLLGISGRDMDPIVAAATADNWKIALEDVPPWALQRARVLWLKGKLAGTGLENANLAFPPTPPQFRRLVDAVLLPFKYQRGQLTRLLSAKVEEEFSREHQQVMLQRLSTKLRALRIGPSDFDESGARNEHAQT
jgi:hypothetical protein